MRGRFRVLLMKKLLFIVIALLPLAITPAANAVVLKGAQGQVLTVSATTAKSGSMITVSGNRFDETIGIYLAFCVVPAPGNPLRHVAAGLTKQD